jgi:hypothetical protein
VSTESHSPDACLSDDWVCVFEFFSSEGLARSLQYLFPSELPSDSDIW